ncbi:hypothetical protein QAD02_001177 [Eretmocerus hayati]|uniref:Uncharacterized protein n=1 Tax=Eretmocerus hayati TaxID=131215 RepID=A0ACC2NGJ3_9HYME|nr:hypothetical protein QAD02_001177 [Eretmocerus hayati]
MEKLRVFERKCLRACLGTYRTEASNYTKYVKSQTLYDSAYIHRIDCHILRIVRNHFAQVQNIRDNSLIFTIFYPNPLYFEKTLQSGYIPPEAFIYLDQKKLIQDKNNIPILYHAHRRMNDRRIIYDPNLDCLTNNPLWRFARVLPERDVEDAHRFEKKFWWLADDSTLDT